ncbi:hypothetical protein Tco_0995624 [Tanacetum coccineum]
MDYIVKNLVTEDLIKVVNGRERDANARPPSVEVGPKAIDVKSSPRVLIQAKTKATDANGKCRSSFPRDILGR